MRLGSEKGRRPDQAQQNARDLAVQRGAELEDGPARPDRGEQERAGNGESRRCNASEDQAASGTVCIMWVARKCETRKSPPASDQPVIGREAGEAGGGPT